MNRTAVSRDAVERAFEDQGYLEFLVLPTDDGQWGVYAYGAEEFVFESPDLQSAINEARILNEDFFMETGDVDHAAMAQWEEAVSRLGSRKVQAFNYSFDEWMDKVDKAVEGIAFVSVHDLADAPFMDWYEAGMSPARAARKALKNDGFTSKQAATLIDVTRYGLLPFSGDSKCEPLGDIGCDRPARYKDAESGRLLCPGHADALARGRRSRGALKNDGSKQAASSDDEGWSEGAEDATRGAPNYFEENGREENDYYGRPVSDEFIEGYEEGYKSKSSAVRKGGPFAGYKDFDDCVAQNQDKDDPNAYCGKIKHNVEGKLAAEADTLEYECYDCGKPYTKSIAEVRDAKNGDGVVKCPHCDGGNDWADFETPMGPWSDSEFTDRILDAMGSKKQASSWTDFDTSNFSSAEDDKRLEGALRELSQRDPLLADIARLEINRIRGFGNGLMGGDGKAIELARDYEMGVKELRGYADDALAELTGVINKMSKKADYDTSSFSDVYAERPPRVTDAQVAKFQKALESAGYSIDDDEAHDILVLNGGFKAAMDQAGISTERANDARWGEDDDIVSDDWGLSSLVETTDPTNWTMFGDPSAEQALAYADAMRQKHWADRLRQFAETGKTYSAVDDDGWEQHWGWEQLDPKLWVVDQPDGTQLGGIEYWNDEYVWYTIGPDGEPDIEGQADTLDEAMKAAEQAGTPDTLAARIIAGRPRGPRKTSALQENERYMVSIPEGGEEPYINSAFWANGSWQFDRIPLAENDVVVFKGYQRQPGTGSVAVATFEKAGTGESGEFNPNSWGAPLPGYLIHDDQPSPYSWGSEPYEPVDADWVEETGVWMADMGDRQLFVEMASEETEFGDPNVDDLPWAWAVLDDDLLIASGYADTVEEGKNQAETAYAAQKTAAIKMSLNWEYETGVHFTEENGLQLTVEAVNEYSEDLFGPNEEDLDYAWAILDDDQFIAGDYVPSVEQGKREAEKALSKTAASNPVAGYTRGLRILKKHAPKDVDSPEFEAAYAEFVSGPRDQWSWMDWTNAVDGYFEGIDKEGSSDAGELRDELAEIYRSTGGFPSGDTKERIREVANRLSQMTGLPYEQVIEVAREDAGVERGGREERRFNVPDLGGYERERAAAWHEDPENVARLASHIASNFNTNNGQTIVELIREPWRFEAQWRELSGQSPKFIPKSAATLKVKEIPEDESGFYPDPTNVIVEYDAVDHKDGYYYIKVPSSEADNYKSMLEREGWPEVEVV